MVATAHVTLRRNVEVGLSDRRGAQQPARFESYDAPIGRWDYDVSPRPARSEATFSLTSYVLILAWVVAFSLLAANVWILHEFERAVVF